MQAPSFLYSGIDKETLSLSDELNSLGGGDAQATHFELHAIVKCGLRKGDQQLLWPYENMIGLRDVTMPAGSPITKNMKYYTVDSVTQHEGNPADKQSFGDIALDAAHWVNDGFNSCIFSVGMRACGKTTAMFGQFGVQKNGYGISNCLAGNVLEYLYEQKKSTDRQQRTTLAISAWYVQLQQIVDLIAPEHSASPDPLDFASVECPDLSTACRVLHECRTRAPGCTAYDTSVNSQDIPLEPNVGHFFARILLHRQSLNESANSDVGNVSYMYLVDLAGLASMDNAPFAKLCEEDRIAARANNLQLQCLFKVLGEMRSLSAAAGSNPLTPAETALTSMSSAQEHHRTQHGSSSRHHAGAPGNSAGSIMKMTSARDSKLTTILAPIIQGNVKTSVLLFLQDGAQHASETYNLLNALNGITDIMSACIRVKEISLRSLGLIQHEDVLGPHYDSRHHSMMQAVSLSQPASPSRTATNKYGMSGTPQSTPGRTLGGEYITDTSTDYGEIDLDHILSGDFNIGKQHSPKRSTTKRGARGVTYSRAQRSAVVKKSPSVSPKSGLQELHAHYDPRSVAVPHDSSEAFVQHRHDFNHSEAHPGYPLEHHAHYDGASLQQAHQSSREFVQHRHDFNHSEAPPGYPLEHHAHYDGASLQQAHQSSREFIQHRHDFNHSEAHPGYPQEHHAHYDGASLLPEHSPSKEFVQHRRSHYHAEAHHAASHAAQSSHPHYDAESLLHEHNPSPEFVNHRRDHYHAEAQAAFQQQPHAHYDASSLLPEHPPSPEFANHRRSHYHGEAHPGVHSSSVATPSDADGSPMRSPHLRSSVEVVQALDEFHDLMEELENDQATMQHEEREHALNTSHTSAASSIGWPRQVVSDFLHSNRGGIPNQSLYQQDSRSSQRVHSIGPGEAQYGADESFFSAGSAQSTPRRPDKEAQSAGQSPGSPKRRGADMSIMADSLFGNHVDASFDAHPTRDDHYSDTSSAHGNHRYRHERNASSRSVNDKFAGIGGSTAEPVRLAHMPRLADTAPLDLDTVNYITSSYADFFQNSLGDEGKLSGRSDRSDRWGESSLCSRTGTHNTHSLTATPVGSAPGSPAGSRASSNNADLNNTVDSLDLEEVGSRGTAPRPSGASPVRASSDKGNRSQDGNSHSSRRRGPDTISWASTNSMTSARSSGQGSVRGSAQGSHASQNSSRDYHSSHQSKAGGAYHDDAIPAGHMSLQAALAEVEHLRRTNQSLSSALNDETNSRSLLQEKLNAAQDDLLELRTQCEVQQDNFALQEKQLKAQLRSVCDNQSLTDVFATFEDNVARLVRENEALRQINLQLEAKELDSYLRGAGKDVNAFDSQNKHMSDETFHLHSAKKENLRLLTRLKKSGVEREALKKDYEELKLKERHFLVNTKIANDCARRLRSTHQELVRTKRELEVESAARAVAERDLHLIRDDTVALRTSEAALKEERARYLAEIAGLRERVREVDHERKRMTQLNRFVNKHSPAGAPEQQSSATASHQAPSVNAPSGSKVPTSSPLRPFNGRHHPYSSHIAFVLGNNRSTAHPAAPPSQAAAPASSSHSSGEEKEREKARSYDELLHAIHQQQSCRQPDTGDVYHQQMRGLSDGTVAQAGLSDAQYHRIEESDGIDPSLEVSLTAMHESLIATTPQLLPLFRKLTTDIHTERTRALQKRSQLLSQIGPKQYENKPADLTAISANKIVATAKTAAAYSAMLKSRNSNYAESFEEKANAVSASAKNFNRSVRF